MNDNTGIYEGRDIKQGKNEMTWVSFDIPPMKGVVFSDAEYNDNVICLFGNVMPNVILVDNLSGNILTTYGKHENMPCLPAQENISVLCEFKVGVVSLSLYLFNCDPCAVSFLVVEV